MKVSVVNEQDELIGYKERQGLSLEEIYRVSALWVTNSLGQVLLAKRALTKSHHPGKWGPAVAGTVEEGETYAENIVKEMEEELGIKNVKVKLGPKLRVKADYNHFTQWFTLVLDDYIFVIDEKEVAEIKWWGLDELKQEIKENPDKFLKSIHPCLDLFCN